MAIQKMVTAPRSEHTGTAVINAVEDEALREEVSLIVAATGRPQVEEAVLASWRRAPAIFIDSPAARRLSTRPHCEGLVFLVRADAQEEDTESVQRLAPVYSASLPADNVDIVELLGRGDTEPQRTGLTGTSVSHPPSEGLRERANPEPLPGTMRREVTSADRFSGRGHRQLENPATCTLLVPAVGGAGASVTAAAFSLVLSREQPVCLVDADELGGGIDLVLGMESVPGLRWQDFSASDGRLDGRAVYEALPANSASPMLRVLTWARGRDAQSSNHTPDDMVSVLNCLILAGISVVVDCPKQIGFLTALGALADDTAIVTPTSVRAIAAAGQLAEECVRAGLNTSIVVRYQQHRDVTISDVEYAIDLPISGEVEFCRKLSRQLDVDGVAAFVGKLARGLGPLFERAMVGGTDG